MSTVFIADIGRQGRVDRRAHLGKARQCLIEIVRLLGRRLELADQRDDLFHRGSYITMMTLVQWRKGCGLKAEGSPSYPKAQALGMHEATL
jgi:hypothetical protein